MFKRRYHIIKGMTLIELMTALFLTVLILGAVITVYLAMNQSTEEQTALINIQERSRSVMQHLTTELHLAGDFNCTKKPVGIRSYDEQGLAGFCVEYFDPHSVKLVTMKDGQSLLATKEYLFKEGDQLIITDCQTVDLFKVEKSSHSGSNQLIIASQPLSKPYTRNAEVSHFQNNCYYVKKTTRKDKKGQWINALYIKDDQQNTEWVEGVNALEIAYDVLENDTLKTKQADELNAQSNIVGVSLLLKFTSLNHFVLEKTEYLYAALLQ